MDVRTGNYYIKMGHDLLNVAYSQNVTDYNQTTADYEKQRQQELANMVDISRYYIEGVILMPVATIGLFGKKNLQYSSIWLYHCKSSIYKRICLIIIIVSFSKHRIDHCTHYKKNAELLQYSAGSLSWI